MPKLKGLLSVVLSGWLWAAGVAAEPQRVRLPEGNAHGFLVVRTLAGEAIAYGELVQKPTRGLITSRLLLHFNDGSLYDETVAFSQKNVFRLERYQLVQRGPSFPKATITFDRTSGQYRVQQQEKQDSEEQTASGPLAPSAAPHDGSPKAARQIWSHPAPHQNAGDSLHPPTLCTPEATGESPHLAGDI
jgi:hypothetical protein